MIDFFVLSIVPLCIFCILSYLAFGRQKRKYIVILVTGLVTKEHEKNTKHLSKFGFSFKGRLRFSLKDKTYRKYLLEMEKMGFVCADGQDFCVLPRAKHFWALLFVTVKEKNREFPLISKLAKLFECHEKEVEGILVELELEGKIKRNGDQFVVI